ncbi:hypothetical protein BKI52_15035 [marine bacterium AO1-C]|nr:hypothetical protein BKI52_15035 [marine bacterium AO1-C]
MQPRKPHINFNLQRMEVIYQNAGGTSDEPHRHDYYTILLVEQAKGRHVIDYHSYKFEPYQVHFVAPGQIHQVAVNAKPSGWVITFARDFLIENNIPESFLTNINLFKQFGETPPLHIDKATCDRLMHIMEQMEDCMPLEFQYRIRALGALLQLFLIYCNNSCTLDTRQLDEENSGVCLLRDFKDLVETNYQQWHKVGTYAEAIPISPKHLSFTVKNLTGKTAKEFIQDRLVLEAKRLLMHTELSVKEVAYRLGFEEPLHFSNFFKKQVGISPSGFKHKQAS